MSLWHIAASGHKPPKGSTYASAPQPRMFTPSKPPQTWEFNVSTPVQP